MPEATPTDQAGAKPASPSLSPFRLRLRRFRQLKRGYYAFLLLTTLYVLSFLNPLIINSKALVVRYQGSTYYPLWNFYQGQEFGQTEVGGRPHYGEANYRELRRTFREEGQGNWVWLPLYAYHPNETLLTRPDDPPSWEHWLGTDALGRDIFARLAYGFRFSLTFALAVTALTFALGIASGALLGYFGGRLDLYGVRLIEIWTAIPFLYTVLILSASLRPSFYLLALLVAVFEWVGIALYLRGEVLREKARDYVAAAVAVGERDMTILFRHILPNSLTPVIALAPFYIVGNITTLVSLDFLGFGIPPPTASWGELLKQGWSNIQHWHLVLFPLLALVLTLLLIVFVGEAVREALDPKVYSRLR